MAKPTMPNPNPATTRPEPAIAIFSLLFIFRTSYLYQADHRAACIQWYGVKSLHKPIANAGTMSLHVAHENMDALQPNPVRSKEQTTASRQPRFHRPTPPKKDRSSPITS
jgi:hypothetical protein